MNKNRVYKKGPYKGQIVRNQHKIRDLKERFEEKIFYSIDGCWLWTANSNSKGYGQICFNHKMIRAHRLSYEIYIGKIPKGLHVLHKCDTPGCVNPNHLFVGSNNNNVQDKVAKERVPKGDNHSNAKLTTEMVLEIKSSTESNEKLASRYGVTWGTIFAVRTGRSWKHVNLK